MNRPSYLRTWTAAATVAALTAVTPLLTGQQATGSPGRATGAIMGTVYDSTAAAPLAGATVLLTHASRADIAPLTLAADSAGHFAARDLVPGRWIVAFLHRAAEEYGVAPVPREVTLSGDGTATVTLALPQARTLRTAVCGPGVEQDSAGVIVGSVRDEDTGEWVAGATVTVEWRVMELSNGLRLTTQRVPVLTGTDGTFRICGVPTDDPITVRAVRPLASSGSEALASGDLYVTLPSAGIARTYIGVGRLPLAIVSAITAPAVTPLGVPRIPPRVAGRARLEGVVSGPEGKPLPGARILVIGTGQGTASGENGTFRLDSLPTGSWTIEARAIGYTPQRQAVVLRADEPAAVRLSFAKWVPALDRVVVFGKMSERDRFMTDFLERKARGLGRFITEDDIERLKVNQISEMLVRLSEVRLIPSRRPGDPPTVTGRAGCPAEVFVNGSRVAEGAREIDWLVRPSDVMAIEVHDPINGVPGQFGSATSCLVIGIWTKK